MRRILVALCLFASACGSSPTSAPSKFAKVEYLVTGTATRASMTYAASNGATSQQSDRVLPWSFDTTLNVGDFMYISAQNSGTSGCVTVEIKVRNVSTKSTQSCGSFVIATASGTVE